MRSTYEALEKIYPAFVIDSSDLKIVGKNEDTNKIVDMCDYSKEIIHIFDIIKWDEKMMKDVQRNRKESIAYRTWLRSNNQEVILVLQCSELNQNEYINVCIVDNLEDINVLEFEKYRDSEVPDSELFSKVFKYSPIGLVLVDENIFISKANKYIFKYFALDYEKPLGKKFGNLFNCSVVEGTNCICGEVEDCRSCHLRAGVTSVLATGNNIEGVELSHEFTLNGRKVTKWFTISAAAVYYENRTYALVSFVDISERVRLEQKLEKLGKIDELTGLYNRRHIINLLQDTLLNNSLIKNATIGIIDIDNFKRVNDTYGHLIGDEVLKLLSHTLDNHLRDSDYIGRYGGEEFIIIFPDTKVDIGESILNRINTDFKTQSKTVVEGGVTFSGGITEVFLDDSKVPIDYVEVLGIVDKRLYKAKGLGKNRIEKS